MSPFGGDYALEGCGGGLGVMEVRYRNPTHGRQGKRPAFGAAHVVGNIEEFVNANDTRRWRFSEIAEGNQYSERHRPETHCGFGP